MGQLRACEKRGVTRPLLQLEAASRRYVSRGGFLAKPVAVQAVAGVSLQIARGETLGLVGESGCGKSTTGRLALGLERPDSGDILFDGKSIVGLPLAQWRQLRQRMQLVYQDPLGALDRRLVAAQQIGEPLDIHSLGGKSERLARVADLMQSVGLGSDHGQRFPHELSGGQRQRVIIARALASGPDLLVCDEAVAALDVSIQAQVVNLLMELQARLGLSMLFISHDLKVVRQISHRIAVMYLGQIVETGSADDLFADPQHPYTRALVAALPSSRRRGQKQVLLEGEPPNPAARPSGCAFHPRCAFVMARCRVEPPLLTLRSGQRFVSCHLDASSHTGAQAA